MQITTQDDIKQLGTILGVWAHPDDETVTCAGIMMLARQNGQRVVCVTATRGEAGVQDEGRWPQGQLATIRSEELGSALRILEVTEHQFLEYKDGACATVPQQDGVAKIADLIEQYQPDSILTFGPDGLTGHSDHQTVGTWAIEAARASSKQPAVFQVVEIRSKYEDYMRAADEKFDIYFNIDKPPLREPNECDICVVLPPDVCAKKRAALRAMPSQMEAMMQAFPEETLAEMFASEAFIKAE